MRGVLDTDLIDGPLEVFTKLRPVRYAVPYSPLEVAAFVPQIQEFCQFWAGASWPLLPVSKSGSIPELYLRRLEREAVDYVRDGIAVDLPSRVAQTHVWATPLVYPLSSRRWGEHDRPVDIAGLAESDPWRNIYAALLGSLPSAPSTQIVKEYDLREDLKFEDIVMVERSTVVGSLEDLVERLKNIDKLSPRQLSNLYLAAGMSPDTSFLVSRDSVPFISRCCRRVS